VTAFCQAPFSMSSSAQDSHWPCPRNTDPLVWSFLTQMCGRSLGPQERSRRDTPRTGKISYRTSGRPLRRRAPEHKRACYRLSPDILLLVRTLVTVTICFFSPLTRIDSFIRRSVALVARRGISLVDRDIGHLSRIVETNWDPMRPGAGAFASSRCAPPGPRSCAPTVWIRRRPRSDAPRLVMRTSSAGPGGSTCFVIGDHVLDVNILHSETTPTELMHKRATPSGKRQPTS